MLFRSPSSTNCFLNNERISEGYSDWYGLMLTISSSDVGITPRGYAAYYYDQGPNGAGVRPYPYSTDLEINPLVYSVNSEFGEFSNWTWASVLWELTWTLIDQYGLDENLNSFTGDINLDAGNVIALAIVTESLKIINCDPNLVDARDAILGAFRSIYGYENECLLWNAFAKRGLGLGADSNSDSYVTVTTFAEFYVTQSGFCDSSDVVTNLGGEIGRASCRERV